jgi:hypothetical protein
LVSFCLSHECLYPFFLSRLDLCSLSVSDKIDHCVGKCGNLSLEDGLGAGSRGGEFEEMVSAWGSGRVITQGNTGQPDNDDSTWTTVPLQRGQRRLTG